MHMKKALLWLGLLTLMVAGCRLPASAIQPTVVPTTVPTAVAKAVGTTAPAGTTVPTAVAKVATTSAPVGTTAPTAVAKAAGTVSAPAGTTAPTAVAKAVGTTAAPGGTTTASGDTTPRLVAAANAFIGTLDATQKTKAVFEFSNTSAKAQWSNLPSGLFNWIGVRMGDLSGAQQQAARDLLSITLSTKGYNLVMASVAADEVLKTQSGNNPLQFGSDNYYVAFFGTPSTTTPWMWRFGGHHVTVNAVVNGSTITLAPSMPGCQPCQYTVNGQTVRPVGAMTDKAFALINALDATQREQAILDYQQTDLVLGPMQTVRALPGEGLQATTMTAANQALLLDLVGEYVGMLNDEDAAVKLAEVRANLANTYFAWSGDITAGSVVYFRVTGATLHIEYADQNRVGGGGAPGGGGGTPGAAGKVGGPPGGTPGAGGPGGGQVGGTPGVGGGGATTAGSHIHAIFRDPTNDYGIK